MSEFRTPGVYVKELPSLVQAITGVSTSVVGFIGVTPNTTPNTTEVSVADTDIILKQCTNFREFKEEFGDFSSANKEQSYLAHAVYGFFQNGGSRCYVVRAKNNQIQAGLKAFAAIDEISIVAAPGLTDDDSHDALITHCRDMGERFALLDTLNTLTTDPNISIKTDGDLAAVYYPWIKVFDPATNGIIEVPPSGHIAGIYARVDYERGIHKAPANESIIGVRDVTRRLSKIEQGPLNEKGINCIRDFNGNIVVWGARTLSDKKEYQYINVRRTLLYLRESIDKGTQWAIFEPNNPLLWQKITRNVSDFLLTAWRNGALFGNTPQEAFYVKCDAETNPSELREQGQVNAEVGVSIVRPAEFVIFSISQFTGTR